MSKRKSKYLLKVKTFTFNLSDGTYVGKYHTKKEVQDVLVAQDRKGIVCLYEGSEWGKGKLLARFMLQRGRLSSANVEKCYAEKCALYGIFEHGFCDACMKAHNIKTEVSIESRIEKDESRERNVDGNYIYVDL